METLEFGKITISDETHLPETSCQTGFPSPATHYAEASIDLNKVLIGNKNATFFIRVTGDKLIKYNIHHNDVLIVDRALNPSQNKLLLIVSEGIFKVTRYTTQTISEFTCWGIITHIIHKV